MDEFQESTWGNAETDKQFRDTADYFIPERQGMLRFLVSFYKFFVRRNRICRILDLGCGNGVLAKTLYNAHPDLEIVLVDGSEHMLAAAQQNLAGLPVTGSHCLTFGEISAGKLQTAPFDFIVSSFAIHHLYLENKRALFAALYHMLLPGGYFQNLDVVLPSHSGYEDWYYTLWREWIAASRRKTGLEKDFTSIPEEARTKPENHYDRLQPQLDALRAAGFTGVECFYRFGLFAIYGGCRD